MTRSRRYLLDAGALLPLLISNAPRSFLAHDEGYYALQARWIQLSGQWLAPLWWQEPLFDRPIGVQWLIALSQQWLGPSSWAAHVPSLLAAVASLVLTARIGDLLMPSGPGPLAALMLAMTPLWLNYAHQATQDMPLLAVELLGIWALLSTTTSKTSCIRPLLAGLWLGPAFLIKGFMVVLPAAALLPLLILRRRHVLRRWAFWVGLTVGWLPVLCWLALSLQHYGPDVVGGLFKKLLFLSRSDVYAAGPLYYLWNLPANTAPWSLAALAGLVLGWRSWRGEQRLVLLIYPLTLLLLLSSFRTKTPYYGLQLTPFLSLWGATALQRFSRSDQNRMRGWTLGLASLGGLLISAAVAQLWPGSPLTISLPGVSRPVLAAAAMAIGLSWALLPLQRQPRRILASLLLGPWLALVLLVQAGLFTDRSPLQRLALQAPQVQAALREGPVAFIVRKPFKDNSHSQLILAALGSPELGPRLRSLTELPPGQWAWIQRHQLPTSPNGPLRTVATDDDLAPWTLVRRDP